MDADHVVSVGAALLVRHAHDGKLLSCSLQARCGGVLTNLGILQVLHPLFDRRFCHLVEFLHYEYEVLGEHLIGQCHALGALAHVGFLVGTLQSQNGILFRHARELRHAVVGIILAFAEVEVEDVDGVNLADDAVVLTHADLVNHAARRAEEDALEEVALLRQLYLHEDVLSARGFGLDIHAVGFVLAAVLVALALDDVGDGDGLSQ